MIDFIVVDYKTPELALRAVESILERTPALVNSRITRVDAAVAGFSYAQAVHHGVRVADEFREVNGQPRGEIVCALNADVECLDSQQVILDLFSANPDVAVIGPRQVDSHGHVRHGGIFAPEGKPYALHLNHRFWGQMLDEVAEDSGELLVDAATVSGSVYYCRRSVWDELGGFLTDCPHYYEETWLSYLARHRGYRVCYTGATTWLHHWLSSPVEDEWLQTAFRESQAAFLAACEREGIVCD